MRIAATPRTPRPVDTTTVQPVGALTRTPRPSATPPPTPAEAEQQIISSLFTLSENRVRPRTPAVLAPSLPQQPTQHLASRAPTATAAPQAAVQLEGVDEVARLVNGLRPADSRLNAARGLLRLWGHAFQPSKEANNNAAVSDFYKVALDHGMRCSELWVNFDALQQINLPGILEVFSPRGPESRYVVLAAVHEDGTGTILWGTRASARVKLASLDECWRRRVFVFWEEREPLGEIAREGDTGAHVQWLQRSLATLSFFEDEVTGVYGPSTRRAVVAFQEAHRLLADGVAGPRTRMVLYSQLGQYPTPNLAPSGETPREYHSRRAKETAG